MSAALSLFPPPVGSCLFFLGTHESHWLRRAGVPLFVSRRRLARIKRHRPAIAPWAMDSGGFTEITDYGGWTVGPAEYAAEVRGYRDTLGLMQWAAIQDWMCEPVALAKTGKTVAEHQALTIRNYLDLTSIAPDIPWIPVIQGWEQDDYQRHADDYARARVDLAALPTVGVGSVCRRQDTAEAAGILRALHRRGLKLHGFGLKLGGLERAGHLLTSADSLAWSDGARWKPPMPGHTHKSCANCMEYALAWREKVLGIEGVH